MGGAGVPTPHLSACQLRSSPTDTSRCHTHCALEKYSPLQRDAAGCRQAVQAPQSPEMGDLSPSCDRRRPIHIPCGYRPNSLIAGGTTNAKRNIEHAGRHLWSSVSAVSLGGGGVFQREHPVQRTAAGFLREGELRTHWVAGMERSANTHSASPATKALDRPARKCRERQVSSCWAAPLRCWHLSHKYTPGLTLST